MPGKENFVKGLATVTPAQAAATNCRGDFFLRDGDVYVFYGDSITDNEVYPRMLENYVLTRFPSWNITFYNLGWGGDVAKNIFRLQREVLPVKPTVFTENMGMNDGCFSPINAGTVDVYTNAYRTLIPMLRECNPEMRIVLISEVPYENQPGKYPADGAYPQTLQYLARTKEKLAREFGVAFIDLFTAYAKQIGYGKIIYPDFILSGDGIHPNAIGQTIVGMIILKSMNAPAQIAGLDLNIAGNTLDVTQAVRCKLKDVKLSSDGVVGFARLAEALPCPIEPQGEQTQRFLGLVNFADELNRDILTIAGLSCKAYELKINDVSIDIYTADELASGVNIAEPMKGPHWDQARAVARATRERQAAHNTKWRSVWLKDHSNITQGQYDLSNKARIDELDAQAQAAVKKQHELNRPKWMTFTLTPAAPKPTTLPVPVTIGIQPPQMEPLDWSKKDVKMVDLRTPANRPFAGESGWLDVGPKASFGAIPVGRQLFAGVPFEIIDPAKNNDKSMVVIGTRPDQKGLVSQVVIPLGHKASVLNFLHAGAWMSISDKPVVVEFAYAGGIKIKTRFAPGYHIVDWWQPPQALSNGVIAWTGICDGNPIGVMYAPVINPRPEEPIESILISLPEGSSSIYGLMAISYLE
jgi:lysophospholipase L1-like esterase